MRKNELAWMWAVNENLWLLDAHDGYLITRVKTGQFNANDLEKMLKSYGLFRWLPPSLQEQEGQVEIIRVCNEVYTLKLPKTGYWELANERWFDVMGRLKRSSGGEKMLWSACMKLYWFYQPDKLPMFDNYAFSSLGREAVERDFLRKKSWLKADNFLEIFSKFYRDVEPEIRFALAKFPRKYPYPTRVAEKYLWLHGTDNMEERIRKFEQGLKIAPLPPR